MPTRFVPTQEDVDRYRTLRAVGRRLNSALLETIPPAARRAVEEAMGVPQKILEAGHPEVTIVILDACLFDWFENGKNLVQRYSETLSGTPDRDEGLLLSGYLASQYRIVIPFSAVPDAGVHCRDALNGGEELFMMDVALSRHPIGSPMAMATRTIPMGAYCIGAGAGLPIDLSEESLQVLLKYQRDSAAAAREGPCGLSVFIARTCFQAGFGDSIRLGYVDVKPPKRWPHRRRR